jgi:putative redox protein
MLKSARARQTGPGLRFMIQTGSGHELVVDDEAGDSGPRPAELLLAAQAGCAAFDVASILAKKRQVVISYEVGVSGEQREDRHPHVYRRMEIVHELFGPELETEAVRRAIELSATRYCTASAMFSAGPAEIHHRYLIHREDGRADESGEVVVIGPHADPDTLGTTPRSVAAVVGEGVA